MMSKRKEDNNGWIEVKDNPISKVGVFPYSGAQLGPSADPDRIYRVYRPAEELSDPETIKSFKLLPIIEDHTMLGAEEEGLTPAERKSVEGVIGENVYFDAPFLKANIKIFSERLRRKIEAGKIDLSGGYRCQYDFTPGEFEGEKYDAIQRRPRGNHLALVDEGRMGSEVVVLDHLTFTVDAKDKLIMDKEKLLEALARAKEAIESGKQLSEDDVTGLNSAIDAICGTAKDEGGEGSEKKDLPATADEGGEGGEKPKSEDEGEGKPDPDKKPEGSGADEGGEEGKNKGEGMDGASRKTKPVKTPMTKAFDAREFLSELSERDKLYDGLSKVVGAFDHSKMTADDVADYGAKKLGLSVQPGHARTAVSAYLQGIAKAPAQPVATGMDAAMGDNFVSKFLNGAN